MRDGRRARRRRVRASRDRMRRDLPHRGGDHAERRLGGVSPAERRRNANAIAAARASGARLLQLSSVAVYGRPARYRDDGLKTDEATPLAPLPERAYYARSKRESEELVLRGARGRRDLGDGGASRRHLRPSRPTVRAAHRAASVARIRPADRRRRHDVRDRARGERRRRRRARRHARRGGGRAYNLANDFDVTVRRFFELAARGLGRRIRFVSLPTPVARGALRAVKAITRALTGGRDERRLERVAGVSDARQSVHVGARARRAGWAPSVRPEVGVPDAFRWWRENS